MAKPVRAPVRFGPFELSLESGDLFKEGKRLRVSGQALDILLVLASDPGRVFTREELRQKLWNDGTFVDFEHGLNAAVNRLREILHDSATSPRYIETVPRRGYRLIQSDPVRTDQPADANISSAHHLPAARKVVFLVWASVAIAVALLASTIYLILRESDNTSPNLQQMKTVKVTDEGKVADVALSPDGRYVAYVVSDADTSSLYLRQIGQLNRIQLIAPERAYISGLAFAPDSNFIFYTRATDEDNGVSRLIKIPILGGTPRRVLDNVDGTPSFSPDGKSVTFLRGLTNNSLELHIAALDGSPDKVIASVPSVEVGYIVGPAWSPDGRTVAFPLEFSEGSAPFALKLVDVQSHRVRDIFKSVTRIGRPRWTSQGRALILPVEDSEQRGQLWIIPASGGPPHRLSNDVADYAPGIDTTTDGSVVAAVQRTIDSSLWSISGSNAPPRQLTSGRRSFTRVVPGPNGVLLAIDQAGWLWRTDVDGNSPQRLGDITQVDQAIWCGEYLVASVLQEGNKQLVRIDADGMHVIRLASGLVFPQCSGDAKYVYAAKISGENTLVRVPIYGGAVSELGKLVGDAFFGHLLLSPDGSSILYRFASGYPHSTLHIAQLRLEDRTTKTWPFAGPWGGPWHWSPDGESIQYRVTTGSVSNLWEQNLKQRVPRQITHFTSNYIFDFAWTQDRSTLLLARGTRGGDVVLFTEFGK